MFWKLFGSFGTLIFTSLGILGALVSYRTQQELLRNVEHSLHSQAILLQPTIAPILEKASDVPERALVEQLGERSGVRLTVIDGQGRVLADSATDPADMPSHLDRPEIRRAIAKGKATETRKSSTTARPYMYHVIAIPGPDDVPRGFLRLAMPVDDIQAQIRSIRWMVWGGAIVSALVALLLGLVLANHFSSRVEQLSLTASEIAVGDYDRPIDVTGNDQIGTLAHALHRMRRQLTEHIADSERTRIELQTILDTMPEAVVAVDPDQRILFANPTTCRLFGLRSQNLAGQCLWEVLRYPQLQEAVKQTLASSESYSAEFEILQPQRVIAYRGATFMVGKRQGALMVLHDISELRRLERMRQDFIANVSHELKTPLAAIKAFTETLLFGDVDEQTRHHFLTRIDEQADRLHALVVDMLMLARVESKEQAFDIQSVDVQEAVSEAVRSFRDNADAKGLTVKTDIPEDCRWVLADAEAVATILGNLIDNAVKYARQDGWVEVTASRDENFVAVHVADNGIGIPAAELGRIFERFYRVDKARSRELGGTGLGLSIVKHLTQTFGGTVHVESRLNIGSKFTVRLPSAADDLTAEIQNLNNLMT